MKSLMDISKEIAAHGQNVQQLKILLEDYDKKKVLIRQDIAKVEGVIYQKSLNLCHIKEIYRLAKSEFSRLRKYAEPSITEADIRELDKWIGRASNAEGLINIKDAIAALSKFRPVDIKSNLYALVQKIIIEGPYKGKVK